MVSLRCQAHVQKYNPLIRRGNGCGSVLDLNGVGHILFGGKRGVWLRCECLQAVGKWLQLFFQLVENPRVVVHRNYLAWKERRQLVVKVLVEFVKVLVEFGIVLRFGHYVRGGRGIGELHRKGGCGRIAEPTP